MPTPSVYQLHTFNSFRLKIILQNEELLSISQQTFSDDTEFFISAKLIMTFQ